MTMLYTQQTVSGDVDDLIFMDTQWRHSDR